MRFFFFSTWKTLLSVRTTQGKKAESIGWLLPEGQGCSLEVFIARQASGGSSSGKGSMGRAGPGLGAWHHPGRPAVPLQELVRIEIPGKGGPGKWVEGGSGSQGQGPRKELRPRAVTERTQKWLESLTMREGKGVEADSSSGGGMEKTGRRCLHAAVFYRSLWGLEPREQNSDLGSIFSFLDTFCLWV